LSAPPRFRSQVFSTSQRFPGRLRLCGLVSCRHRSWDSSLQSFPLTGDRVPLSRSPGFHAVIHRRAGTYDSIPFTVCFSDFHAFTRSHGSPYSYELPFHALTRASRQLWDSCRETIPFRQLHLLRSCIPPASPFQSGWVSPHRLTDTLLGLCPFRAFTSTPRILDPPGPEDPSTAPPPKIQGSRLEGPQPFVPGETVPTRESTGTTSSTVSSSLRSRPAPLLCGVSFSHGLETLDKSAAYDLQSF
jgi:hypothetical protein